MAAKVLSRILIVAAAFVLIAAAAVALHLRGAASNHEGRAALAAPGEPKAPTKVMYHCPMHPNYISDHPGKCPICGMDLVPFTPGETEQTPPQPGLETHAPLTLSPERRQLIGLQLGTVEKRRVTRTIRAAGRVEYNEKTLATVSLKFGGWVEELMVKSVGETVRKGSPLMAIYSPGLLEAQHNYLVARAALTALGKDASADSRSLAEEMLRSARERLRLWDFTDEQLKAIESSGQAEHDVTIFSKVDGVVTARNVALGSNVEPGRDLFQIADLTTVWMLADVFESEAPLVKVGQQAKIELIAFPGEPLTGTVSYIYPALDESTRTLRVRLECPNPDGRLKPGMFSAVSIAVDLGEQLAVDDDAVLDTGLRQIVFVDKGEGRLEPREVVVGDRADGLAIIAKGLDAGERIVTSGNFLVDSESRMKAALRQVSGKAEPAAKSGMADMPGM
ncbi:MAG: efflux RND transporter periplasmic adaptor subunit [Candidatus Brocadiia bacterium]|jgi:Cu(I)/Ag(I) efflux system membrane fusion protein